MKAIVFVATPSYADRFTNYFDAWTGDDKHLEVDLDHLPYQFLYSMWLERNQSCIVRMRELAL